MPTIGNVNRGTNLTHHFFRSKVGVGRRFQYGGGRRSLSPCACADERLTVYDFKYFQALPFGLFEFEDL